MSFAFFKQQMARMVIRFGAKAFDEEFIGLVWSEVRDLSETGFKRAVDVWIGSRSHNKPPLLSEFRECRLREQKFQFENDLQGAAQFLSRKAPEEMRKHLRAILSKEFGGVESVTDALEVARLRNRIAEADKGEGA